jgi:hypothetical protein
VPFSITFFGHTWAGSTSAVAGVFLLAALTALFFALPALTGWSRFAAAFPNPPGSRSAHAASTFTAECAWTLGLAVRTSAYRVEILDIGTRLTPRPNLYRFPSVLIRWNQVATCTSDQRLSSELDGARHTELVLHGGKVIVRVPGDAGDRVAAEWRLRSSRTPTLKA